MLSEIKLQKNVIGYNELFENGYFSWKSDAPANEDEYKQSFIYNYLNIIPFQDSFIIQLINNIHKPFFTIEANTDRSRYNQIRFNIWQLFKELDKVCVQEHENTLKTKIKQFKLSKNFKR